MSNVKWFYPLKVFQKSQVILKIIEWQRQLAGLLGLILHCCRGVAWLLFQLPDSHAQGHRVILAHSSCFCGTHASDFIFGTEIVIRILAWLCLLLTTPVLVVVHIALVWKPRVHSSLYPSILKVSHQTKKDLNKAQKFRSTGKECNGVKCFVAPADQTDVHHDGNWLPIFKSPSLDPQKVWTNKSQIVGERAQVSGRAAEQTDIGPQW